MSGAGGSDGTARKNDALKEVFIRKLAFYSSVLVLGGYVSAPGNGMCSDAAYHAPAVRPSSRYVIDVHEEQISSAQLWYQLGRDLYETDHLEDALDCFTKGVLPLGSEARYGRFHAA